MKALIYNSGYGHRMGDFTATHHKSMYRLHNGETIFGRQLRILQECGIRDFVVTTGPFAQQLYDVAAQSQFSGLHIDFVSNPEYGTTNYIYSLYLARKKTEGDILVLHGDLVFDRALIQDILNDASPSLATVGYHLPQPEKDFKARIAEGRIKEVSVKIFDEDCYAFQPLYKLSAADWALWVATAKTFVDAGEKTVYAENALNTITSKLKIQPFSYSGHYIDEIDTLADGARVADAVRYFDYSQQLTVKGRGWGKPLAEYMKLKSAKRVMLVCGKSFLAQEAAGSVLDLEPVIFSDFSINPQYVEAMAGAKLLRSEHCDFIIAAGGGSCLDVAKLIRYNILFNEAFSFAKDSIGRIPIVVIPTTAGTGSEATRFVVCYEKNEKKSIEHEGMLPDMAILDSSLLLSLPAYQKKCAYMDALCQCVEAIWAKGASETSTAYAKRGIRLLLEAYPDYFTSSAHYSVAADLALSGANLSGKAINLSKTTAAHAMSYKLTSLYGIPHGHAVCACMARIWGYVLEHQKEMREALAEIAEAWGERNHQAAYERFITMAEQLGLRDITVEQKDIQLLAESVNLERLGNFPIELSQSDIYAIYEGLCPQ